MQREPKAHGAGRRSLRRAIALPLAGILAVVSLSLVPAQQAQAAVVQWGTNSGTTPNYQARVNGDFVMVGNGVLACAGAIASGVGTCSELHSTTIPSNGNNVNDYFSMQNALAISGFTTNSSSATMTIPAGATVIKAFLNWSANTGNYQSVSQPQCGAVGTTSARLATLPSSGSYLTQAVQLKVGSGAIASIAPGSVLVDPTSQAAAQYYSAGADVTSAFAGVVTGSAITVSAGNIWAAEGSACYAGWSLAVVYDYGTFIAGNNNSKPRKVVYYEGHVRQGASDPALTVAFNGFTAGETGTRIGLTLFEGDRSISGDTALYSRGGTGSYSQIVNANGDTNNIGVGQANGSIRYTQSGSGFTNQSIDVISQPLPNIVNGDTTVNLQLGTSGDSYLLRNAILSVPVPGIQVIKTSAAGPDTQSRLATEVAQFSITVTNTGTGIMQNISVTDDQTDCARTLTGIQILPLQSYTYTCVANAPSPATYVSTARAVGYTVVGGYTVEDEDSTTVLLTAIALTKSSALAAGASGRAGDVVNYMFTATNTGGSTLTGVTITDPLVGLSALTYGAWPSGVSGTLASGQTVTATATYVLTQADVDRGTVSNTAATTGSDNDGGPKPTASASRVQTITPAPLIAVTKSGTFATGATGKVGDRINYVFTFTNTGNVTLTNLVLNDPLTGLSPPVVVYPGTAGTLAPGAKATATAFYLITQSDVDTGSVKNTATVTGRTPAGASVSGSSPQSSVNTVASAATLTTTKSGAYTSGTGAVGSIITFTVRATNTGNVTLTGVSIADSLAGLSALSYSWPGTAGTLSPGQVVTATATYTVTQADVDAGSVKNTATTTATSPSGAVLTVPSSQASVATNASAPAVTLTKAGALVAGSTGKAGDVVNYSFRLTNSGNVTLTAATITDPMVGLSALTFTWPATAGTLAPGQFVTATATYTLKQSDVDAGSVVNSASSSAKPPTGANITQTKSATVVVAPNGTLTVLKTGSAPTGTGGVGSTITYSFSATNNGNVTLSQVAIADPLAGLSALTYTWPGVAGTLAPGQTVNATASYTVKQSDVDAGQVTNVATGSGRTPAGVTVSASSPTSRVNTQVASPSSSTVKSSTVSGTRSVGDVITYTFRTSNTGNVTLTGVAIADPLSGLSALTYVWPGTAGTLAPGQTVVATATYTVKQSDVNAGSVTNTASSSASYGATTVPSTSNTLVTALIAASPNLVVTKSGALASGASGRAGETVNWTITLRNTGNVTLTGVSATDSLPGISVLSYGAWPSGTAGTLQPGQSVVATATYSLKQTDVDAGAVSNTATGTGTPSTPGGTALTRTAPATLSLASAPGLTLTKSGAYTTGSGAVGSVITYTFTAVNAGNVTLTGVTISDPLPNLSSLTYTWPGTANRLAPQQTVTATATYTVRQSDLDSGSVKNTATAKGTPPTGAEISATSGQITTATQTAAPAITTSKRVTAGSGSAVGGVVTYEFTATNTGNVTLAGVAISDPKTGLSALTYTWPGATGTLAPGQSVVATATYTVTQADQNTGSITNTSSASGTGGGRTVTNSSGAVTTPTAALRPAVQLTKAASPTSATQAGVVITYTFTLLNTGNVTLTSVGASDPLPGLSAIVFSNWQSGTPGTLQPGQTATASATYTVTQSDVDAGSVVNAATTTGTPPSGAAVTGTGSATVTLPATPTISVVKTGSVTTGDGGVGSIVTWGFTIRNTGNVTLTSVALADTLVGLGVPSLTWDGGTAGTLRPGQAATGTATYTIKQADVDAGSVKNTATVTGRSPADAVATASSGEITVATKAAAPALTLGKTATPSTGLRLGNVIEYNFTVTNSGNQTISGVSISDPKPGLSALSYNWPGTVGVLAPGQSATATATYTVTQADVNAGSTSNTATVAGTAPGAVAVTAAAPTVTATAVAAAPALSLVKGGALANGSTGRAGDTANYTFTVRNTGNVTISAVTVTDPLPGLSAIAFPMGFSGSLAPGQSVIATASYILTQPDVDSGSVSNIATANGTPARGTLAAVTAPHTIPITSGPALTLGKTGVYSTGSGAVGSVITYTFTVRNTGNVSLTGVAVTDPKLGASSPLAVGALAPNQSSVVTATYTLVQADVNAGAVTNTATATGTTQNGAAPTATSPTVRIATVVAAPSLDTLKSGAYTTGSGAVGSVITYSLSARNAGNVTLTSVAITDSLPGISAVSYGAWPGGVANTLQPGATVTATATYTLTQADVDLGTVTNAATTTGLPPTGPAVTHSSATVVTPTVAATPKLTVTKSGVLSGDASTIAWTVTVLNDGNLTISGITVDDPLLGGALTLSRTTLAPGQTATATANFSVSQTDVDAGAVSNTANAKGTPARGAEVAGTGSSTVPIPATPLISVTKTGSYTTGSGDVGSVITYTYTAVNDGNVTLTGVAINDPHSGLTALGYTWPGAVGTLAPQQSVTATATYTLVQSDVNAGSVVDTATVRGTPPSGAAVTGTSTTVTLATDAAAPSILTEKVALAGSRNVGDLVTFEITLTNTGNVTLTSVSASDPKPGLSVLRYGTWPVTAGTLQPGQNVKATATYRITQQDVDSGSIQNTATGTGTPPTGAAVTSSATATTATANAAPALVVTKSGALSSGATYKAGNSLTFSFTIRNTGNVTITGVQLNDALAGLSAISYVFPGVAQTLAPGQTATATATYTMSQADVDAGFVVNTATASGVTPAAQAYTSPQAQVTVVLPPTAKLDVAKLGALRIPGQADLGDIIDFTVTVRNAGNVTMTNIALGDSIPGLVLTPDTVASLAPGASVDATGEYAITSQDLVNRVVLNTATATGTSPVGATITGTSPEVRVSTGAARAQLEIVKDAEYTTGTGGVGSVITYTFTVTNTGNQPITGVGVDDLKLSPTTISVSPGALDPDDVGTATATYTVLQSDLDAGKVDNSAVAVGTGPSPDFLAISSTPSSVSTATTPASPSVTITDSGLLAATGPGGSPKAGDIVTWTYVFTNTGNVTLSAVSIADTLGVSAVNYAWTGTPNSLAPQEPVTATSTYAITQADIDAGSVSSIATGYGTPPRTTVPISATNPATVALAEQGGLSMAKSASKTTGLVANESVTFTFVITNTGNVTIDGITVEDLLQGLSTPTFPTLTNGTLAPGASATGTATYTFTQTDVDNGGLTNTAAVSGTTPTDVVKQGTGSATLTAQAAEPTLTVVKRADKLTGLVVGDTINYTFDITNTGNVTLTAVALTDSLIGLSTPSIRFPGADGVLAPSAVATATASYRVTQADIDSGSVSNTAAATGRPPAGGTVTAPDSTVASTTVAASANLSLVKSGALAAGSTSRAGDLVEYVFTITNTGNVTVSGITLNDPLLGGPVAITWPGTVGQLAPAASVTVRATYTLIQPDVDAGAVINTATTTGTPARGTLPTPGAPGYAAQASATVPITPGAGLAIVKEGKLAAGATGAVGDVVEYTLSATNTGNVTLTQGQLIDVKTGVYDIVYPWPASDTEHRLDPGQTVVGTAKYNITQADVDAGVVTNTARATALTPQAVRITRASNQVILNTVQAAPALTILKSGSPSLQGVGDPITYTFTVTNTGNVTVNTVTVSDPLIPQTDIAFINVADPAAPVSLAPGESVQAEATYLVTQNDVNRGTVLNTATTNGEPVRGPPTVSGTSLESVVDTEAAVTTVTATNSGVLAPGSTGRAGDTVTWSYSFTNDGNVTLSGVTLADALQNVTIDGYAWDGAAGILQPGETVTATGTYLLTQADVDAGAVSSIITGTGTSPAASAVSGSAPATVAITPVGALVLSKTDNLALGELISVGTVITYGFSFANTGNVTLSRIVGQDDLPNLGPVTFTWPGAVRVLEPGQTATAESDYTVTQADVDRGSLTNTASVSGVTPNDETVTSNQAEVTSTAVASAPVLTITKTDSLAGSGGVGDTIDYTIRVVNDGNVTVAGVAITDNLPRLSALSYVWPGTAGELAPGDEVTATARYTIIQSDVDAGNVTNIATASGATVPGVTVDSGEAQTVTPTIARDERFSVTKSGVLEAGATGRVGDLAEFTLSITNGGNVTMRNVRFTDTLVGLSALTYSWPGTTGVLLPGRTVTARATYPLTQADIDAGVVSNTTTGFVTPSGAAETSANSTASVVIPRTPGLVAVKTGVLRPGAIGQVGDIIDYSVTVKNTGNVTVTQGHLVDPLPGISDPVIDWPDPARPGVLPPGSSVTGTASYALTQADVDRGFRDNTANVAARAPDGASVTAQTNTVIINTVSPVPGLTVTKTAERRDATTIDYTFVVENTGNVTMSGVAINDALPRLSALTYAWTTPEGVLAPGQNVTATATYTIDQADIDAGAVMNVANASGVTPKLVAYTGPDAAHTQPTDQSVPSILVTKTATLPPMAEGKAGDVVTFAYTLKNTGNVTLTGVELLDRLAGTGAPVYVWPGTPFTLAPGETVTATSTHPLTQGEVNAGGVSSFVDGSGVPPRGAPVTGSATAGVTVASRPNMAVTKSGTSTGTGEAGSTIDYDFTITNTGNVTLSLVDLVDALLGVSDPVVVWPQPSETGILQPGDVATATATYTVTQQNVDDGSVTNTATATGKPPVGDKISVSSPPEETTVAPARPSLVTVKSGALAAGAVGTVGDIVEYQFDITNDGNVTVSGITLSDPLPGLSVPDVRWPGTAGILAPGEKATATATYALKQSDLNAGSVSNTATATGTSPRSGAVEGVSDPVIVLTQAPAPAFTVTKVGTLPAGSTGKVGDVVSFALSLTNTGNQTLTNVSLSDSLTGISALEYSWPTAAEGVLQPREVVTATATYVLTQPDIDAGSVVNTATGVAASPAGAVPAEPEHVATATVEIPRTAGLVAVKTGVLRPGAIGEVGDIIDYSVTVENTGNVTVTQGHLVDPLPGISDPVIGWPDPARPGVLPPGSSVTGTASYALTQADVDRGFRDNTAHVAARAPDGTWVTAATNTVIINTVGPVRELSITKSGAALVDGAVGDTIRYTFTVRNTGNVTMTGVTVADPLSRLSGVSYGAWPVPANPGVLAPGEQVVATADYLILQDDVDAGSVTNTATATGTPPNGVAPVTFSSNETVVRTAAAAPAVSITNRGELAPGATGRAGDIVIWTYVFTNDGNVSLTGVELSDAVAGIGAPAYTWDSTAGTLRPGESVTGKAEYTLTQNDVDSGAVSSIVTGTGQVPSGGAPATATQPATLAIVANPTLTLVKTQALAVTGQNGPGDVVNYGFTITNTGSVTMTAVVIRDALDGVSALTYSWPGANRVLRPGESATATARYTLSQEDMDHGSVDNRATVTGTPPSGAAQTYPSNTVTTVTKDHAPSIATVKSGAYTTGTGAVGSVIEYYFVISNTGNVTLNLIALQESLVGVTVPELQYPSATGILGPGNTATGTATYTVTQDDVDRGSVGNLATAVGTSPRGVVVTGPSNTVTIATATANPGITTTHTAALAPGLPGVLGDRVDYSFVIENTGNQTLDAVTLSNTLTDLAGFEYTWPATAGTLLPGAQVTITASRAVTQADVDAGRILNVATGTGNSPSDQVQTDDSAQTIVPLAAATAALSITKSGSSTGGAVGDTVTYAFTVTNTGLLTVSGVKVTDPKLGAAPVTYGTWPNTAGTLAPGEQVTATAGYTITQADVDSGAVRNTASVSGAGARGGAIGADSNASVVTTDERNPVISLTKAQPLAAGSTGRAGDRVAFSYTVSNTGNVTLGGVSIVDPQPGLGTLVYVWPNPALPGTLLPGQSATATINYPLTQADVDAGGIASTATASGTTPSTTVTSTFAGATPVVAAPALTIVKSHTVERYLQQDGGIRYRIEVTNSGNVTLTGVTIEDPMPGLTPLAITWPAATGTLAPGQTAVATARYVVTQDDVDLGTISNTATANGSGPASQPVTASTTHDITIQRGANVVLDMDIVLAPGDTGVEGDTLLFRHTATNSGTETLRGLTITDLYPGLSALDYAWPGEPGVLLPGQSVVATGRITITAGMAGTTVSSTATVAAQSLTTGIRVVSNATASITLPTLAVPFPGLPNTGSAPLLPGGFALLLIIAGLLLTVGARRRSPFERSHHDAR